MAHWVVFCVESSAVLDLHHCPPPPCLLLPVCLWYCHLYAMPKVNPRNKIGGAWGQWQYCRRELLATDLLVLSVLVLLGKSNRWMEDEMFATNKQLLCGKTGRFLKGTIWYLVPWMYPKNYLMKK
jgi:hypothetical protein